MSKRIQPLLLSSIVALAISSPAFAGAGDDCCDDVEDLQRQILLLQSQLDELKEQRGMVDHTVTWDPAPRITSSDKRFTWEPRGQLLFDYANVDVNAENNAAGGSPLDFDSNGTELRSGRLGVEGTMFGSTHYVLEVEFADHSDPISLDPSLNVPLLTAIGVDSRFTDPLLAADTVVSHEDAAGIELIDGTDGDLDVRVTDAYLWWDLGNVTRLKIGQFKESASMAHRTAIAQDDFMDQPGIATGFGYGRRTGVMFEIARPRWLISFAGFGENLNVDIPYEEGWALETRAGWLPIKREKSMFYLGFWWTWRDTSADFPFMTYNVKPSHMSPYAFASLGLFPADHDLNWGGEASAAWGPVSVQGELARLKPDLPGDLTPDDPIFWTWYMQASWFITGESRSFSLRDGAFTRTRVRHPVNDGGWGAWQLAARYDNVNLTDDPHFEGGEQTSTTVGINWLLNDYMRLMANYVHTKVDSSDGDFNTLLAFGLPNDATINTIEMRAQLDFGPAAASQSPVGETAAAVRNGRFLFEGQPGVLWIGLPDWSYGSDTAGGPLLSFESDKNMRPMFDVSGMYEPDVPFLGDGTRVGIFVKFFGAMAGEQVTANSKDCSAGCPDVYVSVDGTSTTSTDDPLIDGSLSLDHNFWETGLTLEVDHDLSDKFTLTKTLALFGGGQQQEYEAIISDGGPIGGATSFDNQIFEDVDSWRAGIEVGLRATYAMSKHFSAFIGGNVGYVRESSDLKAQDCSDGFAGDGECTFPSWETSAKAQKTFNTYRAGAKVGLKLQLTDAVSMGVIGELRNDFVPEVQNPRDIGESLDLKKNHETSYGGRFTLGFKF